MTHHQHLFVRESSVFFCPFFLHAWHCSSSVYRRHTHKCTHGYLHFLPLITACISARWCFPELEQLRDEAPGMYCGYRVEKEKLSWELASSLKRLRVCSNKKKKKMSAELKLAPDYRLSCRLKLSTLIMSRKECVAHTYACNR